ncbi:hypothetical protein [Snodgrassella alvi]|uniref:hypothetical protein n=1 Tax=Snodgrassella alvi TaxID=1196083 RepID=UPI000C1F0E7A|nr:hypothetical protein [Snodgrassella alvi]PIT13236.1 hypothetical protein BGI33_11255 [Snodgrassella alvi]PIT18752.1 hypothetical protein BGI34_04230 [Snodgrassella alvi]
MKSGCKKIVLIVVLLWQMLLLAGCDYYLSEQPEKQSAQQVPEPFRNQDSRGRYDTIGKLGTHSISIPAGVIDGWARYVGDPGDFADPKIKAKYQRPPKTYDLPIESFGFLYRITDGDVYTSFRQTQQDYRRDNETLIPYGKPFPWASVSVYGQYDAAAPLNFNFTVQNEFKLAKDITHFDYIQQEQPLYNLTLYRANNGIDPETGEPWKWDDNAKDIFIKKDQAGNIKTYIKCQFTHHINSCSHMFYNDRWHIQVWISYSRTYLPQWQEMEGNIIKILDSWRVSREGKLLGKQIGKA